MHKEIREEKKAISVLAICVEDDRAKFESVFFHTAWEISYVLNIKEVEQAVSSKPFQVIICPYILADRTTWLEVLALAGEARVIVSLPYDDDRMALEVIYLNGFDYLVRPFAPDHLRESVIRAWSNWYNERGHSSSAHG